MPTVMVVEDEYKLRELIRSYLERAGLAVLSTGSGAEALSFAQHSLSTWWFWTSASQTCLARRWPVSCGPPRMYPS